MSAVENTTHVLKELHDWFKSYNNVKWCIPNDWILLSDEVPSFVYMTQNEVNDMVSIT